jgi:hypothetical protein
MRAFMVIVFASALFLGAWANNMKIADAGQTGAVSIDPLSMMATARDLPTEQFPGY